MEWWEQLIQILILMVGAYLVYYARQKGKNQADKNDIKGITKTVEDVKSEYTVELEKIRAELNVFTSKKNVVFQEQKEAIIDFSSCLNKWTWVSMQLKADYLNAMDEEVEKEFISMVQDGLNSTVIAFSRLQLIVQEEDIVLSAHQATKLALKHQKNIATRLSKLIQDNIKFEGISKEVSSDDLESMIEGKLEVPTGSGEKLLKERIEVIHKFIAEVKESRDEANKARLKFVDFAKSFLNQ